MKIIVRQLYFLLFCVIFVSSSYARNLSDLSPGPKIEGPYLWVIIPTHIRGIKAAASGIDFLSVASGGAITESKIAKQGSIVGDSVGNKIWTPGSLDPESWNNINEMLNSLGLAAGNMTDHVAYGSIVLDSPARQSGLMFVGTDDSVKVWLNGKLVHETLVIRPAEDYQDVFRVTLKKGKNILLVSVYEHLCCGWSGFFGFEAFMEYKVLPPRGITVDLNEDGNINGSDLLLVIRAINFSKFRKNNPQTDVNKDGVVDIRDLQLVIDYLDNPITGAAPRLQNAVSHPKRKLATAWAKLKMR